ncbi:major facilitator superfamily protein [Cryptosporidium serpentis]
MPSIGERDNISLFPERKRSSRSSFPTLQGLYMSLFEGEMVSDENYLVTEEQSRSSNIDRKLIKLQFFVTVALSIVACMDHGFVACNLEWIEKSFGVGYTQSSIIGSMVYMGFLVGSLVTGIFLPIIKSKILLLSSLIMINLTCLYSFKADSLAEIYSARFFTGFFQAVVIVYIPLWVDQYAPKSNTTSWLAYQQLSSMLGILSGYLLGGILTCFTAEDIFININSTYTDKFITSILSWRGPFFIQFIAIIPIIGIITFLPASILDIGQECSSFNSDNSRTTGLLVSGVTVQRSTDANNDFSIKPITNPNINKVNCRRGSKLQRSSILLLPSITGKGDIVNKKEELSEICSNPIYIFTTLSTCGVYCFVTGLIFWMNQYLTQVILIDRFSAIFTVFCVFLVGPTLGVYLGGITGDILNEYRPQGFGWILTFCFFFSLFGFIASMAILKTKSYIAFVWGITIALFFLTGTLPMSLIVSMKCVSSHIRPMATALAQFIFNLFGFLIAPVFIGAIMDIIDLFPFGALKYKYDPHSAGIITLLYLTALIFFMYGIAMFSSCCYCMIRQNATTSRNNNQTNNPMKIIIQ